MKPWYLYFANSQYEISSRYNTQYIPHHLTGDTNVNTAVVIVIKKLS